MPMPSTASAHRPANTSGTSKLACAISSMWPMPTLAATVSEITEPTNASVIATFREPKKYGSARGMPTLSMMSRRWAPSARSTSSSSGSRVASPVATLTTMGKKEIRNAVRMAGGEPMPNHSTRIGTTATFGTQLKPIMIGYRPL